MLKCWNSPNPNKNNSKKKSHSSESSLGRFSIIKSYQGSNKSGGLCASESFQMTNASQLILWQQMLNSEMFSDTEVMFYFPIPFSPSQRYNRQCTSYVSFGLVSSFAGEHPQLSKSEGDLQCVLFDWKDLQVKYSYTHMEWSGSVFPSAGRLMNNGEDVEYTDDEMMAAINPIVSGWGWWWG